MISFIIFFFFYIINISCSCIYGRPQGSLIELEIYFDRQRKKGRESIRPELHSLGRNVGRRVLGQGAV